MATVTKIKKLNLKKILEKISLSKICEVEFMNTLLDPDSAALLLQGNENNRHLSQHLINKYVHQMDAGKWVLNGETIKIAKDGRCLDGQHRLNAIMLAKEPAPVTLALNLVDNHFRTIDTGRSRSVGDILKIAGYKNVHCLGAASRMMLTYQDGNAFMYMSEISSEEILDAVVRWPKLTYFPAIAERLRFVLAPSIGAFFMYVTQHIDADMSYDFFNKLETGEKLAKTHPILMLRELLLKYKAQQVQLDKRYCLAYLINTWNAYYNDEKVKTIKWQTGQPWPDIEGVNTKALFKKNSLPFKQILRSDDEAVNG